jgi:hypothetical protein
VRIDPGACGIGNLLEKICSACRSRNRHLGPQLAAASGLSAGAQR